MSMQAELTNPIRELSLDELDAISGAGHQKSYSPPPADSGAGGLTPYIGNCSIVAWGPPGTVH